MATAFEVEAFDGKKAFLVAEAEAALALAMQEEQSAQAALNDMFDDIDDGTEKETDWGELVRAISVAEEIISHTKNLDVLTDMTKQLQQ